MKKPGPGKFWEITIPPYFFREDSILKKNMLYCMSLTFEKYLPETFLNDSSILKAIKIERKF